jgi:hypothetical protein
MFRIAAMPMSWSSAFQRAGRMTLKASDDQSGHPPVRQPEPVEIDPKASGAAGNFVGWKIFHFDRERIPERTVHARGSATHGYFKLRKWQRAITNTDLLQRPANARRSFR